MNLDYLNYYFKSLTCLIGKWQDLSLHNEVRSIMLNEFDGLLLEELNRSYFANSERVKNFVHAYKSLGDLNSTEIQINDLYFDGAGEHSCAKFLFIMNRIRKAFSMLSGMQQNGGMGSDFDEKLDEEGRMFLETVVQELINAFGLQNKFKKI